jgi:polyisoprenoid-binding protein YceI
MKNKTIMKKTLLLVILSITFSGILNSQGKLTADKEKSKLEWLGEKVTGQHAGSINLQSGWLDWQDNKIVSGEFNIDMTSMKDYDGNERLEGHLKSEDFFGVQKYPVSKLVLTESTSFEKGTGLVKGLLTIKGVTHPVEFRAAVQKTEEGNRYFANIIVDRSKYDIRYGSGSFFENLGDKTIYDEFKLKVNLLLKKS